MPAKNWMYSVNNLKKYFNSLREQTYVFSTVRVEANIHPKDNLYMWGHYAYGHRGIAIEFDPVEIASKFIEDYNTQHVDKIRIEDVWIKVDYEDDLSPITKEMFFDFIKETVTNEGRKTLLHKYYDSIAKSKSAIWKNENEWRLLWQRDDTKRKIQKVPINEKAIVAVYIGLSASKGTEEDILFEIKRIYPHAKVFRAEKVFGSFALAAVAIGRQCAAN